MAKKPDKKEPSASDKLNAIGIEAVCERIANADYYHVIAKDVGVSRTALMYFLGSHEDMYARAREARADKIADDILHIADDSANDTYTDDNGNERTNTEVVARSRLRVDARKWLASKMLPKKYGDKLELAGDPKAPLTVEIVRFGKD